MIGITLLALALAGGSGVPAVTLMRQDREDTIYTLSGNREKLEVFRTNVGARWSGGTAVDADASDGKMTYWAYSKRTAVDSRAFIMPAMFGGLQLNIEDYSEAKWFPAERGRLDQVAVTCGIDADPFFVTPTGSIEIIDLNTIDAKTRKCLSDGARRKVNTPQSSAQTGQR